MEASASIVPFEASHAVPVLAVIGAVFDEYAMTFDPSDYDADLTDIPGYYGQRGGQFWVLVADARVVGTVAAVPAGDGVCEVKRLYLAAAYRGRGLGRALMGRMLDWARASGHARAVAWSDARLVTAHGVYERLGFARFGERTADDIDRSREYGFRLELTP
ncbi:MAG: GNAT family N-acetyltransferase [Candidatus Rokuibacteriota bacterium]